MVFDVGVHLADPVEPVEREHDLAVMRDLAADEPGVAALRHDRRSGLVREPQDGRHLGDRARPQHHRGVAVIEVAHLEQIRLLHRRIGDGVSLADDRREAGEQVACDSPEAMAVTYDIHGVLTIVAAIAARHHGRTRRGLDVRRIMRATESPRSGDLRADGARGARARRSLMASPRSSFGIGITAMAASRRRRRARADARTDSRRPRPDRRPETG